MGRNQAQRHRTARSSVKGATAYRASRKPRPRRATTKRPGLERMTRGRKAIAARRRSRGPLLFYVLVASVAAQLAAVFAGSGALVALFTLLGLLVSAVVINS